LDWNNINESNDTSGLGPIEYDQSKVPQFIRKHADNVRGKSYGQQVREAQARNAEYAGLIASEAENKATNADLLSKDTQNRFKDQIEGTTNADEIIDARRPFGRNAYQTVGERLDATDSDLNARGVNVKLLGAVGDGETDDTEILQYALNNYEAVYLPKPDVAYKTTKTLWFEGKKRIFGDNGWESTIHKVTHETAGINRTFQMSADDPIINYDDYDAILMSLDYNGDKYGVRIEGIREGLYNKEQSTSVNFDNVFNEYCEVGLKAINLTYFSGNAVSADFNTQVNYWFVLSYGSIDGMGMEYSEGQLIRNWLSNVSISGIYAIGTKNNTDAIENAKTNAKIEVWSENRVGTGLVLESGDLRDVTGVGNASSYSVIGGSYLSLKNIRDPAFRSTLSAEINDGASTVNRDTRDAFLVNSARTSIAGNVEINGINYTNPIIGYQSKSWYLPDKFVWTEMTGNNKTILNIPISEVVKRYPNFLHSDGYLTAPYSVSIYLSGGGYIGGLKILGRNVYRERVYTLNTTNSIASTSITAENLVITLAQNATYIKVFIKED